MNGKLLYDSKSGEREYLIESLSQKIIREKSGRRDSDYEFGTNSLFRDNITSREFCNLSEVVVKTK